MALSATRWGVQVLPKIRPVNAVNVDWNVGKYKNQLDSIREDTSALERKWLKIDYVSREYCKYGMLNHDQLFESDPIVAEARRRMTDDENQARYFRVNRALLMSANHQILPRDQWTPMDADHNYLRQRINDVKNETYERKLVKCATLDFEDRLDRMTLVPFRIINYMQIKALRNKLRSELVAPQLM